MAVCHTVPQAQAPFHVALTPGFCPSQLTKEHYGGLQEGC